MRTYKIKKGEHYSSGLHFLPLFNISSMTVKVKFHANCLYVPVTSSQGVNKLFGFSQGLDHMENSKRIGWTSDGQQIILYYFDHVNGKFTYEEFRRVNVEEEIELSIMAPKKVPIGYRLYPYFGGTLPAPHDMEIDIRWL